MTRIDGDWIAQPEAQAVFDALESDGHRAFFVGGCVRNGLLGQPVSDIDIATDAVPDEVIALSTEAGLKPVPTGIDHGTITVVSGHLGFEVTTFRRDVETDGRRAVVAYSKNKLDDALRRDFTMNALYADRNGLIFDPLGKGLDDLAARRVRFIEDAEARIREDYLRILRFFRFYAWYGDPATGPDPDALDPIARLADGIETLSRERVGHEMRRLLRAPDPGPSLAAMHATGVLSRVLPGADPRFVPALVHLEDGAEPDAMARLAALGGENAAAQLKLSKSAAELLRLYRDEAGTARPVHDLAYRHGSTAAMAVARLRAALTGGALPASAVADAARGASARFPVRAADLMPALQGPDLGARLKELEARWIDSGFTLSRDELLADR